MSPLTSRVEPSGRILIPAVLRKQLGIGPGDELIVDEKDGVLRLYSRARAVREVQESLARFADGSSWSQELIASRREEARRDAP